MTGAARAAVRFVVLAACAAALQLLPRLFAPLGDAAMALYFLHLYLVLPLCAFFLPLWAGKGGVHPFAGFFPVGGALLLMRTYESPLVGCLCLLLSLVGCVAGQELKRRREADSKKAGSKKAAGKNRKERPHGSS